MSRQLVNHLRAAVALDSHVPATRPKSVDQVLIKVLIKVLVVSEYFDEYLGPPLPP